MANKPLTALQKVMAKAEYNVHKRIREQKEEEAFKATLETGNPLPGTGGNYETDAENKKGK